MEIPHFKEITLSKKNRRDAHAHTSHAVLCVTKIGTNLKTVQHSHVQFSNSIIQCIGEENAIMGVGGVRTAQNGDKKIPLSVMGPFLAKFMSLENSSP